MRCPNCGYRNPDEFKYCGKCGSLVVGEPVLEKRWATILFYDVSGYSRYANEHDLEDTHRELNYLLHHCRQCVHLHGGHIDKFFGDGMLAVFGASNSRENEPLKALRSAVCMVRRLDQGSLRGRAAITTGLVMLGPLGGGESTHQTVIGEAVNLAQRMVTRAPTGTIWLDETTSRLVPEARLEELGERAFKGFNETIRVWKFHDWGGRPEPLFGRQLELERVLNFLDQTERGLGRVITVSGQLGIGKSFLINEALRLRAGRIKPIFVPKLDVSDPVRQRLRSAFYDNLGPQPMDRLKRLGLGELDRRLLAYALGMESEPPAPLDEVETALIGTMRRTLSLLAQERPLAIIAHTGPRDHSLVRSMIESIGEDPIPGVSVFVLRRQSQTDADIVLGPLSGRDAHAYIRYLNPKLDADKRSKIYNESNGNPLQIRLLATSDNPAASVMAAFQSRLDKLPPSHRQAILYAALGRPASWFGVLFELIGDEAHEAVAYLIKEGYLKGSSEQITETSRLEISNPLLSQVASSILPASERRLVHETYWRWLIQQEPQRLSTVAAEHAQLAGLHEEAARAWIAAGDYQRQYGIFTGAENYYRRAAEVANEDVRLQALRRLAELHLQAGSSETALEFLQGLELPWAERLRGLALASLNRTDAARELLQRAIARRPNDSIVNLALINLLPPSTKLPELQQLQESLKNDPDASIVRPFVQLHLAEALAANLLLEKATASMRDAYRGFVSSHNLSRAAEAALAISGYMWHSERLSAAAEWADLAIEHGRRAHPGIATIAWSVRAGLWLDQAKPDEAKKALDQAEIHLGHARNADERARIHAIHMRYHFETGRLDAAIELGEKIYSSLPHPWIAANLALAHALHGGRTSEKRLHVLTNKHLPNSPPPGKALFMLAKVLRVWRAGEDPQPLLKRSLQLGGHSGPYLRYLTLVLWGIYLLDKNPRRAHSLAQYLQRRSSSGGFAAVNQTARLLRAELALSAGEPVAHLLRFETPFGPQRAWLRSLLVRAGLGDPGIKPLNLSGYGILGAWARLSWQEVVRAKQDGSS